MCSNKFSYVVKKMIQNTFMSDIVTWVPTFQKNLKLTSFGYSQMLVIMVYFTMMPVNLTVQE